MKQILIMLMLLMCPAGLCHATEQRLLFCETFDDTWKAVHESTEFSGKTVSWIAKADKSFGIPQITVTVYKNEGTEERLVSRENIDVNPEWDAIGIRNMQFPSEGTFTVALTTPEGKPISSGKVTLLKGEKEVAPKKQETIGGKLEELFKRYAPKKE